MGEKTIRSVLTRHDFISIEDGTLSFFVGGLSSFVSPLHITVILAQQGTSFSWNFHSTVILMKERLLICWFFLNLLDCFHFSHHPDRHIWSLDSSGVFRCKSFFGFLVQNTCNLNYLPLILFWKIKAPSTVKDFVWIFILNRFIPMICYKCAVLIKLFPDMCVMF